MKETVKQRMKDAEEISNRLLDFLKALPKDTDPGAVVAALWAIQVSLFEETIERDTFTDWISNAVMAWAGFSKSGRVDPLLILGSGKVAPPPKKEMN